MKKSLLRNYARLIARVGGNVKKGQKVLIQCEVDQPEFIYMVVEECYRAGAKEVRVDWGYLPLTKLHSKYQSVATLSTMGKLEEARWKELAEELPVRIRIESADPDGAKGANQKKLGEALIKKYPLIKQYRDEADNKYQWCIVGVPSVNWAKKVFPDLPKRKAVEALWEAILKCARADGADPIKDWHEHNADLLNRCNFLNGLNLDYLHYTSKNGTDFKVWMLDKCQWLGGGEETLSGNYFNPNMPTEEVFITPLKGKAEGKVVSTKPLSYRGELIENFEINFKNGKVDTVKAERNEELLRQMVTMDEGAGYLGECALVPYDSPIRNSGVLFFNTLFDENASCHLALGHGFSNCVIDYQNYTKEQFDEMGINDSMIHVDFMIGSEDMSIVGYTRDGKAVQIFKDGNWAF